IAFFNITHTDLTNQNAPEASASCCSSTSLCSCRCSSTSSSSTSSELLDLRLVVDLRADLRADLGLVSGVGLDGLAFDLVFTILARGYQCELQQCHDEGNAMCCLFLRCQVLQPLQLVFLNSRLG